MDFTLKHPFKGEAGMTVSAVTLRRPKVKDIAAFERARTAPGATDLDGSLAMIAILSGLSAVDVGEIDAEDFMAMSEHLAEVLPGSAGPESPTSTGGS